jgi:NAD(P)-dependent dehydrogenase (short-subunit alcohol dehydrogenase family)
VTLDPTTAYATPPQPKQQQEMPGETERMAPPPDHGETTYKGHGRLTGRVAIITGADSGIGRAVAIAYAREGADVLISYLREEDDARETARWVKDAGRNAVLVPGDIGAEAHCKALVERAITEFGRLDILVNNAAHQASIDSIEEITSEEWDRTMRTNLDAMFYLCKAAVLVMQPGSAIINTSSIQSKSPTPELLAYATPRVRFPTLPPASPRCWPKRGFG